MGHLANAKIVAEIAKLGAEIYGIFMDKGDDKREKEHKIRVLEARVAELERKLADKITP